MTQRDDDVRAMAAEIERYLGLHPGAADRAEGIRGWWLPAPLRSEPLDVVIDALESLCRRGVMCRKQRDGVGPLYMAARAGRKDEAER
jgi:hypothetical protein